MLAIVKIGFFGSTCELWRIVGCVDIVGDLTCCVIDTSGVILRIMKNCPFSDLTVMLVLLEGSIFRYYPKSQQT